jgi:hypothetical protein
MNVIFAPHPDDELIGCYSVLEIGEPCTIIFTTDIEDFRLQESQRLKSYFDVTIKKDLRPIIEIINALQNEQAIHEFLFPDYYWELHPEHKQLGHEGYKLWKNSKLDIQFYSTNMNCPHIFELSDFDKKNKEKILNSVYSSQKELWAYEKKYIYFEGRVKYLR